MSKYKKVVPLLAAVAVGVTLSSGTAVAATKKPAAKPATKPAAKPATKAKATEPVAESTAAKPKNQSRSVVSAAIEAHA